jgi:hypothetical protein
VILSDAERDALDAAGTSWRVEGDPSGWTHIVIEGYRLPAGFSAATVDLLLYLHPQFPDIPPDMFWLYPRVTLNSTGAGPAATEYDEPKLGRTWQRFSRHLQPGQWRPGDDLRTWLNAIRRLLLADVEQAAA